ncbi:MAG: response regulator [Desulfovibrionales bacterium]|nr:MAG: response regulator [Desulfovibrionales bacterium]
MWSCPLPCQNRTFPQQPLHHPAPRETKKHLNILLAEDDPLNQLFMQTILKKLGHTVTLASNGQEALDFLKQSAFDCILMDIQMPVMTGDEATREIRRLEDEKNSSIPAFQHSSIPASQYPSIPASQHSRIPIIAVTAHAQPGDRERFLAVGMDDYLGKPVGVDDLARVLERNVQTPKARM